MHFDIFHNGRLDGQDFVGAGFKAKFWPENATHRFPEATKNCRIIDGGR